MIDWLRKQLRDMLTEPDNKTVCIVRVFAAGGSTWGMTLAGYDVLIQHAHFDIQAFGVGLASMVGGLGVALGMKKDSPTQ